MSDNDTSILAWHWVDAERRLRFGAREPVEVGRTYTATGPLELCANGLHASVKALDALEYAPGDVVCRVRLSGKIVTGEDKLCARKRTVIWMTDAATALHEFACWCAERALDGERKAGREPDPRSVVAIAAKRAWLRGEIDDADLAAARAAAGDAAWAAAGDAARAEQNAELERLLLALAPAGYSEAGTGDGR